MRWFKSYSEEINDPKIAEPLAKFGTRGYFLREHLYRLIGNKAIPYLKIPGVGVRLDPEKIEKWIRENEVQVEDWSEKIKGRCML